MRKAKLILYDFILFVFWVVLGVPLLVPAVWGSLVLYIIYYFAPFPLEALGAWGWSTVVVAIVSWFIFYRLMLRGRTATWVRRERITLQRRIEEA